MLIYLDSCAYNRPYDDHSQLRIHLEALSKMQIQKEIVQGKHRLVTSIVLDYENSRNRDETSAGKIQHFMDANRSVYVDEHIFSTLVPLRNQIMAEGLKTADASHVACAIHAGCDYFITTDDRILKLKDNRINVISPLDFLSIEEEQP